ncbi:DUF4288 domain-containing protein [Mucilaginibacter hurinus]|uniref:DUF4288 domain-containing protein n=1 Tax=Mucilaginibacter hurinus TaxID=2201324 RepID=A0A367GTH6_9SPHI|nr:DUF4288 domain-containing protein [Mucilaginibacter hurinus]RCH56712.1 DUF4288 domain-containing protein [Mucilaginibacter hurinus]
MNWYVTKLVFRIVSGDGNHPAQFDEQLRLINADTEKNAFEKANKIGREVQDSFSNAQKQTVKWQFVDVTEINRLHDLTDGTELHYQIHEAPDAELYIAWAHHRSALLTVNK